MQSYDEFQRLRRGADTLQGRDFTGSIKRPPMSGLNPTNAEAYGLDAMIHHRLGKVTDPYWMEPAAFGHDQSLMHDMAMRVAQMMAAQRMQDRTTLSNVASGSVAPIYYPPTPKPMPMPTRPESQQMGYAQQDIRVHGAPGSAQRRGY